MKVYGRLRDAHASAMATEVTVSAPTAEAAGEGRVEPTTVGKESTVKVRSSKQRQTASPAHGVHRLPAFRQTESPMSPKN